MAVVQSKFSMANLNIKNVNNRKPEKLKLLYQYGHDNEDNGHDILRTDNCFYTENLKYWDKQHSRN